jgi:ABC-2 type transport system ATP-binding protein
VVIRGGGSVAAVEAVGLCQGFGRRRVLDSLDVTVESGIVGLLGPNAAGKTTLIRTLATALSPTAGTLRLLGEDVGDRAGLRSARKRMGYLPQSLSYPPFFTVCDWIHYAAWLREVPEGLVPESVDEALGITNLHAYKNSRLRALSGGTLRRVGLAQALVHKPALLLLDEPVASLDLEQRRDFYAALQHVGEAATIIVSTHLIEEIAGVCDEVLIMSGGGELVDRCDMRCDAEGGGESRQNLEERYLAVLARSRR